MRNIPVAPERQLRLIGANSWLFLNCDCSVGETERCTRRNEDKRCTTCAREGAGRFAFGVVLETMAVTTAVSTRVGSAGASAGAWLLRCPVVPGLFRDRPVRRVHLFPSCPFAEVR